MKGAIKYNKKKRFNMALLIEYPPQIHSIYRMIKLYK